MTQLEGAELKKSKKPRKNNHNGVSAYTDGSDAETASQTSSKRGSKEKKRKVDGEINSHSKKARRESLSQPARDPRDNLPKKEKKKKAKAEGVVTRSPSPVIDFDGLSRPSKITPSSPPPPAGRQPLTHAFLLFRRRNP